MRILLLAQTVPWPIGEGGNAQRTGLIRDALLRVGDVDVCLVRRVGSENHPDVRAFVDRESDSFVRTLVVPQMRAPLWSNLADRGPLTTRALAREMAALSAPVREGRVVRHELTGVLSRGYDVVVVRYLRTAVRSGLTQVTHHLKAILDVDDVDWLKTKRRFQMGDAAGRLRLLRRLLIPWLTERRCRSPLHGFDHRWTVSEHDRRHIGFDRSSVLPNVPVVQPGRTVAGESPGSRIVLFVGNLGYAPNRLGLARFIDQVWPAVRRDVPASALRVVGRDLPERYRQIWSGLPGVEVVGFAEDLEPHYSAASVVVAPIYWGGGSPIKVLEALAYARPVVAAPHACDAFDGTLSDGRELWRAESDREFVRGVVTLLRSEELRGRMASAGLSAVSRHYSRDSFRRRVAETLNRLMAER